MTTTREVGDASLPTVTLSTDGDDEGDPGDVFPAGWVYEGGRGDAYLRPGLKLRSETLLIDCPGNWTLRHSEVSHNQDCNETVS